MGEVDPEWEKQKREMVDSFTTKVQELMRYGQSVEALLSVMAIVKFAGEQAKRLSERDADMIPELAAAIDHLAESQEAFTRAFAFASARLEVGMES